MKKNFILLLLLFTAITGYTQSKKIDTLRVALSKATAPDTTRLSILKQLAGAYFISKPDSSLIFGQQAYEIAVKFKRIRDQAQALNFMSNAYSFLGDYVKCFQLYFQIIRIDESINYVPGIVTAYNNIGSSYILKQDYSKALPYLQLGLRKWNLYTSTHKIIFYNQRELRSVFLINIAEVFLYTHKIDSADHYLQLCYPDARKNHYRDLLDNIDRDLGEVETARGHKEAALKYYEDAVAIGSQIEDIEMLSITYLSTANLFHKYKQQDSAEYYAKKALETASAERYLQDVFNAGKVLYTYYDEDHNLPQAYKYLKITTATKDSLFSQDKVKQLLSIDFDEKQRQRDLEAAQNQYQENVRTYALIAGLLVLLLLVFIFWRNSRQRQNANLLLLKKNGDIEAALSKLQLTQTQLIQSEKMASLGELTAGIAHEIQNPLNFVNNFAEVSIEMLEEMKLELRSGNVDEAVSIADDVEQNLEKINHHGKRADGIVKGMLQHSRASSNTKEPTDINKLADEYLRLAYHGLRAKDKSFNAEMVTSFNKKLPQLNIVPQDVGRVLLNLFTNAFYAVQQKQKITGTEYKPIVEVSTRLITPPSEGRGIEIIVRDNGTGISENIKEKIMQPFFTTKPTGEGTGLGLSMSYDIIVKGHSGKIDVNTKEREFTEFIITLPISL
jgi:two-component system NtrC family sensor kinase